jgi:hypothetical protein
MPTSTVKMWGAALAVHEYVDGEQAVRDIALFSDRMPALKTLIDATEEARKVRIREMLPALPDPGGPGITFKEWLVDQDDAMRNRVRHSAPSLAKKYGITAATLDAESS